ncbi:MAG TPA: hypothetical protein VFA92_01630 [Candidatus Binatia bacterium]|nr:hypothetical protein [Candidatus Binatia bacterium]
MTLAEIRDWFLERLPEDWFAGSPDIEADSGEIWVVGPLALPGGGDEGAEARSAAREARVRRFREETREQRVRIAREAERRFGRGVAWGVRVGDERTMFTARSLPVMTRLHLPERRVLDTLVEGGVARSRSEALAWCVKQVGKHQGDWIAELREALVRVEELRGKGPT